MIVFLNGNFVAEDQALVSVFDRSFLYGDGLFETMRICRGKPFRWEAHWDRLSHGADFLKLRLPFTGSALRGFTAELVARNQMPEALLRLTVSRGVGPRGYSPRGADHPSLVMSLHPVPAEAAPVRWRLITSSVRLPAHEPLAHFKTCNKLPQILARAEADAAGADEALLLNTYGHVVEAASSNLFWVQDQAVCTPPLASGILPGVTRSVVFEICRGLGVEILETAIMPAELQQTQGIFLSLSSSGLAEAVTLDGHPLSHAPIVDRVRTQYAKILAEF